MGDGDHGAGILGEESLQPRDAFRIQMVGWLIEQQHVRIGQQQLTQRDAPPFAAGQDVHRCVPSRQTQSVRSDFQRSVDIPSVGRVNFGL